MGVMPYDTAFYVFLASMLVSIFAGAKILAHFQILTGQPDVGCFTPCLNGVLFVLAAMMTAGLAILPYDVQFGTGKTALAWLVLPVGILITCIFACKYYNDNNTWTECGKETLAVCFCCKAPLWIRNVGSFDNTKRKHWWVLVLFWNTQLLWIPGLMLITLYCWRMWSYAPFSNVLLWPHVRYGGQHQNAQGLWPMGGIQLLCGVGVLLHGGTSRRIFWWR